jgi:TetR/AcrR family transcriptional repressor of nem operon
MARPRDEDRFNDNQHSLLLIGMQLIRARSFASIGINDVLREADIPKGSFYHYFRSKEDFGIKVAELYNQQQVRSAQEILENQGLPAYDRLKLFFLSAYEEFAGKAFRQGCLMCNLSTELADESPNFRLALDQHWQNLSAVIQGCLSELDKSRIGLAHLADKDAADWLLNAWSGALTRMKTVESGEPLDLFMKFTFKEDR